MHVRDQTKQYLKFLLQLVLPSNRYNAMEIMKISSRFFVEEDQFEEVITKHLEGV